MPSPAANLTHVTFPADPSSASLGSIRVHPSKGAALEFAVEEGLKYAPVRPGESIAEAIERYRAERTPKPVAGGTVRTPRAAREAEGTEGFVAGKPREL